LIASIFIITGSAFLFLYWFRYTCLILLNTRKARNYERVVAEANGLAFVEARAQLARSENLGLAEIRQSLDRDYRVVTYLLRHAATYSPAEQSFKHLMLRLDYQLMSMWFYFARLISSHLAKRALLEMATVVSHLANAMGERTAIASRA